MATSKDAYQKRGNWLAVAAIDLGTTFSGYAFSFKSDFETNPLKISTNDWSAEGVHNSELKAPSILLLNPDKSFKSFGYRAQIDYGELVDECPEKAQDYYYVKNFKMQLHNRIISLDMEIKDETGKEIPAITVFTESIRFLKDHFLKKFEERKLEFTVNDIFFVITVPAIWSDAAKQFMREASVQAGICSSQMILAYEPEAAALHCSLLPEDQGIAKYFQEGRRLMIVDLGGGTADITVVKVIKREEKLTYIQHVYRVTGGAWGGNQVNRNFEFFLNQVLGEHVMKELKLNYFPSYLDMMKDFEVQKKTLTVSGDKKFVGVKLAGEIKDIYREKRQKDLKKELDEKMKDKVKLVGDKLKFEASIFKRFFQDCVQQIIGHINETFMKRGCAFPSAMILVGGFSEAPVIREAIIDAFPVIKDVVSPVASSLSVLKGSVIFGHQPNIVTGRVCRETLGVSLILQHISTEIGKAKHKRSIKMDGKLQADKSFEKMFMINEVVQLGTTRTKKFEDEHKDSSLQSLRAQPKIFGVYATEAEDPKFITDSGCKLKGTITVNPPKGQWPKIAKGYIDMEAGGTEIIVRFRDEDSGQVTEEKIDFM